MTTTPLDLDTLHLAAGSHSTRDEDPCFMEAAAWFAGQPHSAAPPCVSPVLRAYGIALNDRWDEVTRQRLKPFIPLVVGTAGDGQDEARSFLALDWIVRTFTPTWLDLAGLHGAAGELRALRRIADLAAAEAAGPVVRAARDQSAAAWAAARAAAWAAAGAAAWAAAWAAAGAAAGAAARAAAGAAASAAARAAARAAAWAAAGDAASAAAWAAARAAAWAAAGDAAWAAAGAAAGDAAWAAAGDAAWAAARDAARDALTPTVELLQASALALFTAMCHPEQT